VYSYLKEGTRHWGMSTQAILSRAGKSGGASDGGQGDGLDLN